MEHEFFKKSYLNAPSSLLPSLLKPLLDYLLDLEEGTAPSAPFQMLFENISEVSFLKREEGGLSCLLISCIIIQVLRILKEDNVRKDKRKSILSFFLKTIKTKKEDSPSEIYFIVENLKELSFFSLSEEDDRNIFKTFLEMEGLLEKEPFIGKYIEDLGREVLSKDDFEVNVRVMEVLLEKKNRKNLFGVITKIFEGVNQKIKQKFSSFLGSLLKDRRKNAVINGNEVNHLQIYKAIYQTFKINMEMIDDLLPYLEQQLNDDKMNEKNKLLLIDLIAKIFSFKKSKVSIMRQKLFKDFVDLFKNRKLIKYRYDILKAYFKYLKRFSAVQRYLENYYSKENQAMLSNLNLIEQTITEYVLNSEKEGLDLKIFIITNIGNEVLNNPDFMTQKNLKRLFEGIQMEMNLDLKCEIIKAFSSILQKHFSSYVMVSYESKKNSGSFQMIDRSVFFDNGMDNMKKVCWILECFFLMSAKAHNNEMILYIKFFNSLLPQQENQKAFLLASLFEQLLTGLFNEKNLLLPDLTSFSYFLSKTIGVKWKGFESRIKEAKSIEMLLGMERIIKIRGKLKSICDSCFNEASSEDALKYLDHKLKKYTSLGDKVNIKTICENLRKLIKEDPATTNFFNILKKSEKEEIKDRDETIQIAENNFNKKAIALDFLIKKIKEPFAHIFLECAFYEETLSNELTENLMTEFKIVMQDIQDSTYNLQNKYLYAIACLNAFLYFRKYHKIAISNDSLRNLIEIFTMESFEIANENLDPFKIIIFAKLGKILSKIKLSKLMPDDINVEEFVESLKSLLKIKNPVIIKYVVVMLIELQNICSEDHTTQILENAFDNLTYEIEHPQFQKNIIILSRFLDLAIDKISLEILFEANRKKKKENFFEILNKSLIPNTQENDEIINYEEKCALKFFKLGSEILFFHHDSFFNGHDELLNEERKKFRKTISTNLLQSGSFYVRSKLIQIYMQNNSKADLNENEYADFFRIISLLVFDKDIEIRKVLFHLLIKNTSGKNKFLHAPFLSTLFCYLMDESKALSYLAKNVVVNFIKTLENKEKSKIEITTFNKEKILKLSPAFSLVYLVYIFMGNDFFVMHNEKEKINLKIIAFILDLFFSLISVHGSRSTNYLPSILLSLKNEKLLETIIPHKIVFYNKKHLRTRNVNKIIEKSIVFHKQSGDLYTNLIDFIEEMCKDRFGINFFNRNNVVLDLSEKGVFRMEENVNNKASKSKSIFTGVEDDEKSKSFISKGRLIYETITTPKKLNNEIEIFESSKNVQRNKLTIKEEEKSITYFNEDKENEESEKDTLHSKIEKEIAKEEEKSINDLNKGTINDNATIFSQDTAAEPEKSEILSIPDDEEKEKESEPNKNEDKLSEPEEKKESQPKDNEENDDEKETSELKTKKSTKSKRTRSKSNKKKKGRKSSSKRPKKKKAEASSQTPKGSKRVKRK